MLIFMSDFLCSFLIELNQFIVSILIEKDIGDEMNIIWIQASIDSKREQRS